MSHIASPCATQKRRVFIWVTVYSDGSNLRLESEFNQIFKEFDSRLANSSGISLDKLVSTFHCTFYRTFECIYMFP